MNVFFLDYSTEKCAEYHNDKHCVKMILEYAQLLSTAHRVLDGDDSISVVYKATHKNHPSAFGQEIIVLIINGCIDCLLTYRMNILIVMIRYI